MSELTGAEKNIPRAWHGMKMPLEKQVRADDPRMETVYRHFQKNVEDIRNTARKSGAKIVFCTVATNLKDSPPFASLHRPGLTQTDKEKWDDIYRQGIEYETTQKYAEAVERYLAAEKIDDSFADLQFRLGRCYWAVGEYDKAGQRYVNARQLDTLRYRADTRINEIIRNAAGGKDAEGVYLVDTEKAIGDNCLHGITGEELFYEHAHLNFRGNYVLAKTALEQIEKILPERVKSHKADARPLLTEADCAKRLAYTGWAKYKIADYILNGFIKNSPFTEQLYHNEQVKRMERELEDLKRTNLARSALDKSAAEYQSAIQNNNSDWWLHWKYGQLLSEDMKDNPAAIKQYQIVVNLLPQFYAAYSTLGSLLDQAGDLDALIFYNTKAIQIKPTFPTAHYLLAKTYQTHGAVDKAIKHYYKTIELQPDHLLAYNGLGPLLCGQGKVNEAEKLYRDGLLFSPNSWFLHQSLGMILTARGHKDEAIKEFRTALEIDPNSAQTRKDLQSLLKK